MAQLAEFEPIYKARQCILQQGQCAGYPNLNKRALDR